MTQTPQQQLPDSDWIASFRTNWSVSRLSSKHDDYYHDRHDDDAHFRRCWARQDCRSCLRQPSCSWCPFTSACVPNDCNIPALAPAFDEMICPYWAERWELRTRPLGCQVSTITSLTALVTGSGTLLVAALLWLLVWGVHRRRQRRRLWQLEAGPSTHWWLQWHRRRPWLADTPTLQGPPEANSSDSPGERAPLLAT